MKLVLSTTSSLQVNAEVYRKSLVLECIDDFQVDYRIQSLQVTSKCKEGKVLLLLRPNVEHSRFELFLRHTARPYQVNLVKDTSGQWEAVVMYLNEPTNRLVVSLGDFDPKEVPQDFHSISPTGWYDRLGLEGT